MTLLTQLFDWENNISNHLQEIFNGTVGQLKYSPSGTPHSPSKSSSLSTAGRHRNRSYLRISIVVFLDFPDPSFLASPWIAIPSTWTAFSPDPVLLSHSAHLLFQPSWLYPVLSCRISSAPWVQARTLHANCLVSSMWNAAATEYLLTWTVLSWAEYCTSFGKAGLTTLVGRHILS